MKLALKHLSAYLPYKMNCLVDGYSKPLPMFSAYVDDQNDFGCGASLQEITGNDFGFNPDDFKLILRPMSDLPKFIDKISPVPNFFNIEILMKEPLASSYELFEKLVELHFDVFGLIEAGLAVDFNSL